MKLLCWILGHKPNRWNTIDFFLNDGSITFYGCRRCGHISKDRP